MTHPEPTFIIALALGVGVLAQIAAHHLRVPSIVVLFGLGVALGPDGLGWIVPEVLGDGLFGLVELAVAVILFEGGLNLELRRLRRQSTAIRGLMTTSVAITAVGAAVAAGVCLGWSWRPAVLFGTLVVVTGPTVIRPILRRVPLRPGLATIIEAEGVLNDPIGAILATVTLQIVLHATLESVASGLAGLVLRLGFGTIAGLAFGFALAWSLRRPHLIPHDLANITTLGTVLAFFMLCESVLSESGILAVTLAGIVVANFGARVTDDLREFKEHLTVGFVAMLFVLLAADVRVAEVTQLGWPGLATVGILAFVVRPVAVTIATRGSTMTVPEKAFLAWLGPRGIVAAAFASLAAVLMEAQDVPGGRELRALMFLTIAATVVVQGASAPLVARLLGVRRPGRDAIVILGASELGLALARALRTDTARVVLLDANPAHIQAAQDADFPCVYGNALAERTLAQARLEQARIAISVTPNEEVNSLFAREVGEQFDVPTTLAAISSSTSGVTPEMLARQGSGVLFDASTDVERWNVRFRHEMVRMGEFRYVGLPPKADEASAPAMVSGARTAPYLILAVVRGGHVLPMSVDLTPKPDDVAVVALYAPETEEAHAALLALGWTPVEPDPASSS